MKHRRMGLIVICAIHAAGANHPDWRASFFHRANLYRTGMRAQHVGGAIITLCAMHVKRIHFRARRVMPGDIQRVKIIPICINPRAFSHAKTHIGKNRRDFFGYLRNRMDRTAALIARWQSHVQPFSAQTLVQRGISQRSFTRRQRRIQLFF